MTSSDGPRRSSSMEMTLVIPRDRLPPPAPGDVASLDLDPNHPETLELLARARAAAPDDDPRERPTLAPCPAGCKRCPCCAGTGLATRDQVAAWHASQAAEKSAPPPDDAT